MGEGGGGGRESKGGMQLSVGWVVGGAGGQRVQRGHAVEVGGGRSVGGGRGKGLCAVEPFS